MEFFVYVNIENIFVNILIDYWLKVSVASQNQTGVAGKKRRDRI